METWCRGAPPTLEAQRDLAKFSLGPKSGRWGPEAFEASVTPRPRAVFSGTYAYQPRCVLPLRPLNLLEGPQPTLVPRSKVTLHHMALDGKASSLDPSGV